MLYFFLMAALKNVAYPTYSDLPIASHTYESHMSIHAKKTCPMVFLFDHDPGVLYEICIKKKIHTTYLTYRSHMSISAKHHIPGYFHLGMTK